MRSTDDIFEAIDQIQASSSAPGIMGVIAGAASQYGFTDFVVTGLPLRGERIEPLTMLVSCSLEWYNRYAQLGYHEFDPVAQHCFSTSDPFDWHSAPYDNGDLAARRVMFEAGEFGLKDGLCVPIHTEDGMQGCVSLGGTYVDLDPDGRVMLHMLAIYAHARLRYLRSVDLEKRYRLTDREREVLRWAAVGNSNQDIADILGITHRTVVAHISNASDKLGTLNRVHTVVEAYRQRLILI
jgi:LuxR family transcriptional regulator, quorum-sensing system regulator BjaR1